MYYYTEYTESYIKHNIVLCMYECNSCGITSWFWNTEQKGLLVRETVLQKLQNEEGIILFVNIHMEENHHNGYPYLNLSLFCWKYPETSNILLKLIGQWILKGKGRGIARDIWKKIKNHFQNSTKMVTKLGQFAKPGPFSTFQLF